MESAAPPSTDQLPAVPHLPSRDPKEKQRDLAAGLGLAVILFALYLLPSVWRPLQETAEVRVALGARGMLRSGDWLVPRIGSEVRLTKPPLPYWLVASAAQVLGGGGPEGAVTEQMAVLPSAILGALCVFLVLVFTAHTYGRTAGLWAGLILGLSFLFVRFAQLGTGEMPLVFFTSAALLAAAWLACAPRPGVGCALGLGLSLGLAMFTKGHVPAAIVLSALFVEVLRRRRFSGRKILLFLLAMGIAGGLAAPWCWLIWQRFPEARQVLWGELSDAYRVHKVGGHNQNDWALYYLYQFAGGVLPWTPVLLLAWPVAALRKRREAKGPARTLPEALAGFLGGAVLINFLIFYALPKQQYYYLLPLLPPLAIVAARALARLDRPGGVAEERLAWILLALGLLLGAGVACSPLLIGFLPWALSVPLGVLAAACYFAGARQWAEGNSMAVSLALGLAAFALWAGWTILASLHAREHDPLARDSVHLQDYLKSYTVRPKIFSVRAKGLSKEALLYYLDWDRIRSLNELLDEGVAGIASDGRPRPRPQSPAEKERQRLVISTGESAAYLARELGYQAPPQELQVFPLPKDNRKINWSAFVRLRTPRRVP